MSRNTRRTSTKFRASPPSLMKLANDCATVGTPFQGRRYGSTNTGNAHTQTMTNITNHVQRTPLMYAAHVTMRPTAITARDVKPAEAKPYWNLVCGPAPQRLPWWRTVAAAFHMAGASMRSAAVKRTPDRTTTSRRSLKCRLLPCLHALRKLSAFETADGPSCSNIKGCPGPPLGGAFLALREPHPTIGLPSGCRPVAAPPDPE